MNNLYVILLILSQLSAGLYSWLVKSVPTNLSTQLLARMLIFSLASFPLIKSFTTPLTHLIPLGILSATHVSSSYYAYSQLPTAISIPLYYIYPFINIFLSSVFLNNIISISTIPWLLLSFIGTILIVFQPTTTPLSPSGIFSILIAAFTESLMYIVFKSKFESDNFQGLFHLYFGGLIAILLGRATNLIEPFDFNPTIWSPLIIFNLLVGFISISTLVYTINKMPSELFAALAFVGVLSGFIFSIIGKEAKPSVPTLIGSAFIVISAMAVRYLKLDSK